MTKSVRLSQMREGQEWTVGLSNEATSRERQLP